MNESAGSLTIVVQILVALGGLSGVGALLMVTAQKRKLVAESGKTNAEADAAFSEAYHRRASTQISLIEPYEKMNYRLQIELDKANARIDRLTEYVEVLVREMRANGIAVPPMPKKESDEQPERVAPQPTPN